MATSEPDYRRRCLDAKGEACLLCGSEENVVVHHIDGDRENGDLDNLIPVCRSCHSSIHGGGGGELSDHLPPEARTDRPEGRGPGMRPNIRISHQKNGQVLDYAGHNDLTTSEAYRTVIDYGLAVARGELPDPKAVEAALNALDDLKHAMEEGQPDAAEQALSRARDVLEANDGA